MKKQISSKVLVLAALLVAFVLALQVVASSAVAMNTSASNPAAYVAKIDKIVPSGGSGDPIYADFASYGLYQWDGTTWTLLNTVHPASMAAAGSTLYADFAGYGLYSWNGTAWTQLNTVHPASGMVTSGSTLYADFAGYGLYSWNGTTWTLLNTVHPTLMAASGSTLYADFAGYGLYSWNGTTWTLLNTVHPASMVASGSQLYADFAGYGLYKWDGSAWTLLNTVHPASTVASGSQLYVDFAGYGLYSWNGTAWTLLNTVHPASMVAFGSTLYADFAGYGLYSWDGTAWTLLNTVRPASMAAGYTHPPTATGGKRPVFAGTSAALVPWVDDPYIWDTFSLQVLSQPLNGTSSVLSNELVYTPGTAFTSGTDNFTYKVKDQLGDTVNGTAAVRVYSSTALYNCTKISTVNPNGTLNTLTYSNVCTFYSKSSTRVTDEGTPVTMDYFINWPSNTNDPKAVVVLIGGGNLNMSLSGNDATGVADSYGGGNFLIRSAQLFAEAGYITIAINRPSDQPPAGSTDSYADACQYRISVKHAVDILTILKQINTQNLDVFLAGTSSGAMSAVAANLIAAGVSLSSSVTVDDGQSTHFYVGKPGIASLQPSFIKRPVHVLWHQNDMCSDYSPPAGSQALYDSLSSYTSAMYNIASGGVRVTTAGNGVSPDVCGAFDYHGYLGIEATAVSYITNWLNTQVAALAGNNRPEAAFATVTTPAGVPKQTDLATLTRDKDGDPLSYDLSHVTTSLGGSVTLNGSTVTYTPPAGVTNKTDYYVYVVTDSKGSVGAGVITVQIQ